MSDTGDAWTTAAAYEQFMGRWSRRIAREFIAWLRIPAGTHWLEVGCGTGALTAAVCDQSAPASVVACDPAGPLIDFARAQLRDTRVSFIVAGAGQLPRRAEGYGSISSLFALNFLPDIPAAVAEMHSVVNVDGLVSACVWDYAGGMEFLRRFWDAAVSLDPGARLLDEAARFPVCRPAALLRTFRAAGFADVRCEPIEIPTTFADFADYWHPFLGGTGPAPSYVAAIDESRRRALAEQLDHSLPRAHDASIPLVARAWAVCGRRPG